MDRLVVLLFSQVIAGGVVLLRLVPVKQAGRTFFLVMGGTFLILAAIGLAGDWAYWGRISSADLGDRTTWLELVVQVILVVALAVFTWAAWTGRDRTRSWAWLVASGAAVGVVTVSAWSLVPDGAFLGTWLLLTGNFLSAALLLGSVTTGMVLAHWYLAARSLPLAPLRTLVLLLIGSSALVATLTLAGTAMGAVAQARLPDPLVVPSATFPLLVFWRVAAGIAAPLALGFMIRQAVDYGTTTAATGLLYVAVVTVWGGTLVARYLLLGTGVVW